MSGSLFDRYLELPAADREALELFLVVHTALNERGMHEWLRRVGLTRKPAEVQELRARLEAAGLIELWGPRDDQHYHGFPVADALRHALAEHLHAGGRLAPWVEKVRASAPLFQGYAYYTDPAILARELFYSLYLGDNDELARGIEFQRLSDSDYAELLLKAWGRHLPAAAFARMHPDDVDPYLGRAFAVGNDRLLTVGADLLAFVAASSEQRPLHVRAEGARHLALVGAFEPAEALVTDGVGAELSAARAFIAMLRHDFASARQHARDALEHTRTKKTRKLKGYTGSAWPWVTLVLLAETHDAECLALAREELALVAKKSEQPLAVRALLLFEHYLSRGDQESWRLPLLDEDAEDWTLHALWTLVLRFTEQARPEELDTALALARARAHEAGFLQLAQELDALLQEPARGLAAMYAREEPWERALRALESAIETANHAHDPSAEAARERLAWTLVIGNDGEHQVSARVQSDSARSGRVITWKKLSEIAADADFLSAEDRRVMARIHVGRDPMFQRTTHTLAPDAAVALVGHPRVFADADARVPVEVVRGDVRIDVAQDRGEVVVQLSPPECLDADVVCRRDGPGRIVVYALTPRQRVIARELSQRGLRLPEAARTRAEQVLGKLVSQFSLSSEVALDAPHIEEVPSDPRIHVQLWRAGMGLRVRCCVQPLGGGPTFVAGLGSPNLIGTRGGRSVRTTRDLEVERRAVEQLWSACPTLADFDSQASEFQLDDLGHCLELIHELRAASEAVVVEWPEGQALRVVGERDVKDVKLNVRREGGWLQADGTLAVDNELKLTLRQLLEHARAGKGRFVALDDGRFVALSEALQRSLEGAAVLSRTRGDQVELHPLALFGASALHDANIASDGDVRARMTRAREASELSFELPPALEATFRPYQCEGYTFLARLAHWEAGACLADDMGLGKTLQALALLVAQASHGPALVVAPTSVVANWLAEAGKFAPTLRVSELRSGDRARVLSELGPQDVLLCSYGVLQQARELLAQTHFRVVVLDEAQAIKNAATQRARAAMELKSDLRVALTGTPIENHLGELWSIMSFLNPGLLGSERQFDERFGRPIQRDGDRAAAQLLRRLISPFVLRRKKSEVLDDLPEKTVITLRVEPSAEERALFEALREQALVRIAQGGKQNETRIRLLAELTRMRRAACHPRLVVPQAELPSSKLDTLEDLLLELRDGGHRALVFSQFVDYLTIVRERLEEIGVSYQYLDGSTPPAARAAAVQAFQGGSGDVFLISLRAGGFGLNLTAADYVVHLDPWWNPAVEDQASDRAHRIGQTRPVTIYRLVMAGSVEERILGLHGVKRELADDLLAGDAGERVGVDELVELLREAGE